MASQLMEKIRTKRLASSSLLQERQVIPVSSLALAYNLLPLESAELAKRLRNIGRL